MKRPTYKPLTGDIRAWSMPVECYPHVLEKARKMAEGMDVPAELLLRMYTMKSLADLAEAPTVPIERLADDWQHHQEYPDYPINFSRDLKAVLDANPNTPEYVRAWKAEFENFQKYMREMIDYYTAELERLEARERSRVVVAA